MKKKIAIFIAVFMLLGLAMTGCAEQKQADMVIDLEMVPANTDWDIAHIEVKEEFEIDFILPEPGYIKLRVTDATNYEVWPDVWPEAYATFVDENGKELYPEISVNGSYLDKLFFEAGRVTAKIKIKNYIEDLRNISVAWAFAAEAGEPVPVGLGNSASAAAIDENGEARFSFHADYDAIYSFYCAEACVDESDCRFYIENAEGEKVTGEIDVHGTEWAWRDAFLTWGDYTIVVYGDYVSAVAECRVVMEKEFPYTVFEQEGELTAPVNLGFNASETDEKTVKFTADGSEKYLCIESAGTGDYYEYEQSYTLKITDAEGNVVLYDTDLVYSPDNDFNVCGDHRFNLSGLKGEYTVTVQAWASCVISVSVKDY